MSGIFDQLVPLSLETRGIANKYHGYSSCGGWLGFLFQIKGHQPVSAVCFKASPPRVVTGAATLTCYLETRSEDSQTSLSVVYHLLFSQLIFESKFCVRKILAVIAVSQRQFLPPGASSLALPRKTFCKLSVVTEMVCLVCRLNVASVTKELDLKFLVLPNVNSNM